MKKFFLLLVFGIFLLGSSCKKCFHCYNECVSCALTVGSHVFYDSFCRDSFASDGAYNAAISADTSQGYVCSKAAPTYTYDFCVNKPGEEQYQNYFNQGKKSKCDEK